MTGRAFARDVAAFAAGALFAVGLAVSGMTQPHRVIGFLDPEAWDPSLLFVMGGALGVHLVTYRWVRRRPSPVLDAHWHVPTRRDITPRLVGGAALFGLGWGLGGFCPGPGLASLVAGDARSAVFVGTMIAGMFLYRRTEVLWRRWTPREEA